MSVAEAARLVSFPRRHHHRRCSRSFRRPGAIQHLAAGVVFAAVAGGVLPDLRDSVGYLVGGFLVGVAVLLGLERIAQKAEASGSVLRSSPVRSP